MAITTTTTVAVHHHAEALWSRPNYGIVFGLLSLVFTFLPVKPPRLRVVLGGGFAIAAAEAFLWEVAPWPVLACVGAAGAIALVWVVGFRMRPKLTPSDDGEIAGSELVQKEEPAAPDEDERTRQAFRDELGLKAITPLVSGDQLTAAPPGSFFFYDAYWLTSQPSNAAINRQREYLDVEVHRDHDGTYSVLVYVSADVAARLQRKPPEWTTLTVFVSPWEDNNTLVRVPFGGIRFTNHRGFDGGHLLHITRQASRSPSDGVADEADDLASGIGAFAAEPRRTIIEQNGRVARTEGDAEWKARYDSPFATRMHRLYYDALARGLVTESDRPLFFRGAVSGHHDGQLTEVVERLRKLADDARRPT